MTKKKVKHSPLLKAIALGEAVAPEHLLKDYQASCNSLRSEEKRQRIAITKPHIYRKRSLKKLSERMSQTPPKNGLYSNILETADLESVSFSAITADIEQKEDIKDTESLTT